MVQWEYQPLCDIPIDGCVGLFLWAASTGPELYIHFSLRAVYRHCFVLPIVHVPLTGNICLRSPPNRSNAGTSK